MRRLNNFFVGFLVGTLFSWLLIYYSIQVGQGITGLAIGVTLLPR